jgi:hypothetical protein
VLFSIAEHQEILCSPALLASPTRYKFSDTCHHGKGALAHQYPLKCYRLFNEVVSSDWHCLTQGWFTCWLFVQPAISNRATSETLRQFTGIIWSSTISAGGSCHVVWGCNDQLSFDNPRNLVLGRGEDKVLWRPMFGDFACYYGLTPRACQP